MQRPRLALVLLALGLALATAACAGFTFPGQGGGTGVSPVDPDPGFGGGAGGGGAGGGAVGPGETPGPGGVDPVTGMKPSIETPVPGQLRPSAASVWAMQPTIDGRHVTVLLEWWSGPAPCSVLDSVSVQPTGRTITMTPMEGADPKTGGQVACPAIAMLRGTIVGLGDLEPGAYTLVAHGDLAPIEITIK
jgi:hypothetical protein